MNTDAKFQIKEERIFASCDTYNTEVAIPNGITKIGEGAFSGHTNLQKVTIPDSVTEIGNFAFFGCKKLETIIIPEKVSTIGAYAFSSCENLKKVVFKGYVKSIGESSFSQCRRLKHIGGAEHLNNCSFGRFAFSGIDTCPQMSTEGREIWYVSLPENTAITTHKCSVLTVKPEEIANSALIALGGERHKKGSIIFKCELLGFTKNMCKLSTLEERTISDIFNDFNEYNNNFYDTLVKKLLSLTPRQITTILKTIGYFPERLSLGYVCADSISEIVTESLHKEMALNVNLSACNKFYAKAENGEGVLIIGFPNKISFGNYIVNFRKEGLEHWLEIHQDKIETFSELIYKYI